MYSHADYFMTALCVWREARGEGPIGLCAVAHVIKNRAKQRKISPYRVVTQHLQFSSITAPRDPQLGLWPEEDGDATWGACKLLAESILDSDANDPTAGATMYFSDTIAFPSNWDRTKMIFTVKIGHHSFYREI